MSEPPDFNLVSFRMNRSTWRKFLKLCRSKDRSASEVLRTYIDLVVSTHLPLLHKPSPSPAKNLHPELISQLDKILKGGDHQ